MYSVEFSKLAEEQFLKLDEKIQERILCVLDRIRIRPFSFVKRLVSCQHYSMRVGDHRLILDIKHDKLIIFVVELGHRRNIYK
jgi:mRNA interferase RelE/StbE